MLGGFEQAVKPTTLASIALRFDVEKPLERIGFGGVHSRTAAGTRKSFLGEQAMRILNVRMRSGEGGEASGGTLILENPAGQIVPNQGFAWNGSVHRNHEPGREG